MAYINKDNPVYISYAWGEDLEIDVNKLCVLMEDNGIFFKRDKAKGENSLCPYRYNIIDAEEEIGRGKAIIVVISDKYIKSLNCMYEWHCICKTGNITKCVFPIVLPGTKLKQEFRYNSFKKFFEGRLQDISDREVMSNIEAKERKCLENDGYLKDLETLRNYIKENNIPDLESLREDDYQIIIEQLKEYVTKIEAEDRKETPTQISTSAPHFTLSVPDGLMSRDTEEETLFNLVSRNRIVNLVGVGGSGKSSLAYLSLKKHEKDFNEIPFVVVNNNIKDNMVDQLNRMLKLEFEEDVYTEIVSYLQENYKSEKPNLLVLDINETADKDKTAEYINEILKNTAYLAGWKILILSRESVDTRNRIKTYNLNDNEDFDFLKKLFLDKAGARYNDFGDFEGLFKVIYYNPLLTEQLGLYLCNYPKTTTIEDIKLILGDTLREEEMQGMSAQRHDEKVISFLKKLIIYDKLEKNEQELLRHFVLWQSEYIGYDVISDLLKGVFTSEDELIKTLSSLSKRSILATNNEETLSYKLHGLLKDSLREQIDIENEDYNGYLSNVKRIIEYGYYKFVPFVDCIGNSLCEYDITNNYATLNNVAVKNCNSWKAKYSEKLYNKAIKICLNKLSSDKDNPEYQNNLALAFYNLAILQKELLVDYDSAQANYEKTIEIRKQLPKDNPEYQNALANAYNNLAILQKVHFGDYDSAQANYAKAIEIGEQLPKDNPKYQNELAGAYNSFANLQKAKGDYDLAKVNYEKAIEIRNQLPKDNSRYKNDLARTYNNLAYLQRFHCKDYELSKSNYEKAIAIGEQLPKDNPKCQNDLVMIYDNLTFLLQCDMEDYKSAKYYNDKAIEISESLPNDSPNFQNVLAFTYNNRGLVLYKVQKKYAEAVEIINKAIDITKQLSDIDDNYLIYWITYKHSLAEIFFENNEMAKAKDILVAIQPMAKKCITEKPNDGWTQWINSAISALLSKIE